MKMKVTIKVPEVTYPHSGRGLFGDGIYTTQAGSIRIEGFGKTSVILSDGSPAEDSYWFSWRRLPDDTEVILKIGKPPEVRVPQGDPRPTVIVGEEYLEPGVYSGEAGETVIVSDILLVISDTEDVSQRLLPGQRLTRYPEGTTVTLEY